jgi:hypothetical protein
MRTRWSRFKSVRPHQPRKTLHCINMPSLRLGLTGHYWIRVHCRLLYRRGGVEPDPVDDDLNMTVVEFGLVGVPIRRDEADCPR